MAQMTLTQHGPDDPALEDVLALTRAAFAYMDGKVDPPSSIHRLTLEKLRDTAGIAEVWSLGTPLSAAMILTPRSDRLYIGKLSVAKPHRGKGLSRVMINHAAARAKVLNLPTLELETRIELTSNHAAFIAMGFLEVDRTAHEGYPNPTALTFRKSL